MDNARNGAILLPLEMRHVPLAWIGLLTIRLHSYRTTAALLVSPSYRARTHLLSVRVDSRSSICLRCASNQGGSVHKNDEERLLPQEDPNADPNQEWSSGVRYSEVLDGLNKLFPPEDLEKRNAASRKDGYWPYVNSGRDPPKQFTYGEFDLYFFAALLDRAVEHGNAQEHKRIDNWQGKVFCDIGSGTGRLVVAAAALHKWKLARGVEVLPSIHAVAVETIDTCRRQPQKTYEPEKPAEEDERTMEFTSWRSFVTPRQNVDSWLVELRSEFGTDESVDLEIPDELDYLADQSAASDDGQVEGEPEAERFLSLSDGTGLYLAPIELTCGSFEDPYTYYGDADLVFVFSSCMSNEMMSSLSQSIGRQCKPGTIVISTEFPLPLEGDIKPLDDDPDMPHGRYRLELLESIDGWVWLVGGCSTAYIHRVVDSLWQEGVGQRTKPEVPLDIQAWRLVQALEKDELTDSKRFLRNVYNNMAFHGMPEEWRPNLDEDEGDIC